MSSQAVHQLAVQTHALLIPEAVAFIPHQILIVIAQPVQDAAAAANRAAV